MQLIEEVQEMLLARDLKLTNLGGGDRAAIKTAARVLGADKSRGYPSGHGSY
jgi:hypothetical protein